LRNDLKAKHQPPRSFFHNCSGKHLGYVLSIKAEGGDPSNYLRVDEPQFGTLQNIVCDALDRPRSTLPVTTDGCQMPNYAISIEEMARLYVGLANAEHSQLANLASENRQYYMELSRLMGEHPQIIGGSDRLDTSVMSGALDLHGNPHVIAKEGADGMLAIGVGACERYPHGLGVLIKLSSGFDARHMEVIAKEIFAQLGLCTHPSSFPAQPEGARTDHLQIKFHFEINVKQPA
jgi:L-asparaginase II